MSYGYGWKPYVSVAERRKKAEREMAKLRKKGYQAAPVVLRGRKLATTFWGKAWGNNLESYSDFANRLPRGRTYLRNGSVVDLQVNGGEVSTCCSRSAIASWPRCSIRRGSSSRKSSGCLQYRLRGGSRRKGATIWSSVARSFAQRGHGPRDARMSRPRNGHF